jgi:hypothetical protein
MECGELPEVDRQEENIEPPTPSPTPKTPWELEVGSWESGLVYFDNGPGRIWNFTSLGVVPLPPSMWNGARVEIGV